MFLRPRVAVLAALFAALTAVGAQIRIPFPLVPLTLQTPFVLAAGLVLGPRGGMWAMGLYLLMGLFGLPVFAGAGGPQVVLLPTFGFLLGFVGAAGAAFAPSAAGFATPSASSSSAQKSSSVAMTLPDGAFLPISAAQDG